MRPSPVLGTGQRWLTRESIWAIWSWGFATPDTNTGALVLHLLLLLPFSPPVVSGARWAHFPYLCLVLPSVSPRCLAPTPVCVLLRSSPARHFWCPGQTQPRCPGPAAAELKLPPPLLQQHPRSLHLITPGRAHPGASRLLHLKVVEMQKVVWRK